MGSHAVAHLPNVLIMDLIRMRGRKTIDNIWRAMKSGLEDRENEKEH
jgi:hypothetical protein